MRLSGIAFAGAEVSGLVAFADCVQAYPTTVRLTRRFCCGAAGCEPGTWGKPTGRNNDRTLISSITKSFGALSMLRIKLANCWIWPPIPIWIAILENEPLGSGLSTR